MKKRREIRVEKLAYLERTKVKITNRKERVKAQTEIVKRAKGEVPMDWGWKASLIQHLIPVGIMALKELLESEVRKLAGKWYGREGKHFRWGKNLHRVARSLRRTRILYSRVLQLPGLAQVRIVRTNLQVHLRRIRHCNPHQVLSLTRGAYARN